MTNTIIVLCAAAGAAFCIFMQWRLMFRDKIARQARRIRLLEDLERINGENIKAKQGHIKALQDMLEIYQTTPRSLKMAVVLMDHTPGALDVAMRSIGITLPGEAVKKTGKAS